MKLRTVRWPRVLVSVGMMCLVAALAAGAGRQPSSRSPLAPPANGPRRVEPGAREGEVGVVALVGATVHVSPERTIARAMLVHRGGRIESVTELRADEEARPPAGAEVRAANGLHVYPGFVDAFVEVDVPRGEYAEGAPGSHWNPRVTPERTALRRGQGGWGRPIDAATAKALRGLGFVAAAVSPKSGIFRGAAAVVSLGEASGDPSSPPVSVHAERVYQAVGFETGGGARGGEADARWARYPDSQMGAIALIRQTLLDAAWQVKAREAGVIGAGSNALDALAPDGGGGEAGILAFDVDNELEGLRALKIAGEFKRASVIVGSGLEFRRILALSAALKSSVARGVIVPLRYPERPKVETIGLAESADLSALWNWEQGPTNPRRLVEAGVTVCLTSSKIPEKQGGRGAFHDRLSSAVKHGLTRGAALAALTVNPAKLLGIDDRFGTLEAGKTASFVVTDGPLFEDLPDAGSDPRLKEGRGKRGAIIEVWTEGRRHAIAEPPMGKGGRADLSGRYVVTFDPAPPLREGVATKNVEFEIDTDLGLKIRKVEGLLDGSTTTAEVKAREVQFERASGGAAGGSGGRLRFVFDHAVFGEPGVFLNSATVEEGEGGVLELRGDFVRSSGLPGSGPMRFTARRSGPMEKKAEPPDLSGTYTIMFLGEPGDPDGLGDTVVVIGTDKSVRVRRGASPIPVKDAKVEGTTITLTVVDEQGAVGDEQKGGGGGEKGEYQLWLTPTAGSDDLLDVRRSADGPVALQLMRVGPADRREASDIASVPRELPTPLEGYGVLIQQRALPVRIINATVWTCGAEGVIEGGEVAFSGGKIQYVGRSREGVVPTTAGPWLTIDATGRHVTPGIIDCHSHTGISRGVNESGQAVTAEVRIADVTDPDSISWYRQLAGGVTAVNSLHGSANPIGGQNCVNKVRWGCVHPDDMHMEGAVPGIKFALGENVKQSNWGDDNRTRYPQSRMGVEAIIRDRFTAAREYRAAWASAGSSFAPPRRDLELEALGEILAGERLIHCHSYRQDEILMLARLAEEFGFRLGTYQHNLEGYKVADAVASSAIGASLFSDWWAFKVEVQDAIAQAGAIMHEQGVVVSFNSDSDELARRMHVEAGKALKYSGSSIVNGRGPGGAEVPPMEPAEALKFVTLNAAKQLKIDSRVGSLERGKDADVVIWSGPPLSSLSRCEQTFVDGRMLFNRSDDLRKREEIKSERARLIQKILGQQAREQEVGEGGGGTKSSTAAAAEQSTGTEDQVPPEESDTPPEGLSQVEWAALRARGGGLLLESVERARAVRREHYLHLIRRGLDPRFARCGICGEEGGW